MWKAAQQQILAVVRQLESEGVAQPEGRRRQPSMSSRILASDAAGRRARRCCGGWWPPWRRSAARQPRAMPSAKRPANWIRRGAKHMPRAWRPDASRPRSRFVPRCKGWRETLDSLARLREDIREETTQDLVHLAISIAARVIHREVAVDPDALAGLVQAAFSKLAIARDQPRAHAPDAGRAGSQVCWSRAGAPKNLVLTPDPSLQARRSFLRDVARHSGCLGRHAVARDRTRPDRQAGTIAMHAPPVRPSVDLVPASRRESKCCPGSAR